VIEMARRAAGTLSPSRRTIFGAKKAKASPKGKGGRLAGT